MDKQRNSLIQVGKSSGPRTLFPCPDFIKYFHSEAFWHFSLGVHSYPNHQATALALLLKQPQSPFLRLHPQYSQAYCLVLLPVRLTPTVVPLCRPLLSWCSPKLTTDKAHLLVFGILLSSYLCTNVKMQFIKLAPIADSCSHNWYFIFKD